MGIKDIMTQIVTCSIAELHYKPTGSTSTFDSSLNTGSSILEKRFKY